MRYMKCSTQTNSNNSGVCVNANMVCSILHSIDPSGITASHKVPNMWGHLLQGLESTNIAVFPLRKLSSNQPLHKVTGIPILCQNMILCLHTRYKKWLHPNRKNMTQTQRQIQSSKVKKWFWFVLGVLRPSQQ